MKNGENDCVQEHSHSGYHPVNTDIVSGYIIGILSSVLNDNRIQESSQFSLTEIKGRIKACAKQFGAGDKLTSCLVEKLPAVVEILFDSKCHDKLLNGDVNNKETKNIVQFINGTKVENSSQKEIEREVSDLTTGTKKASKKRTRRLSQIYAE